MVTGTIKARVSITPTAWAPRRLDSSCCLSPLLLVFLLIWVLGASNFQVLKSAQFKIVKTNPPLYLDGEGTSSGPSLMGSRCALCPAMAEPALVAEAVTARLAGKAQLARPFQPHSPACEECRAGPGPTQYGGMASFVLREPGVQSQEALCIPPAVCGGLPDPPSPPLPNFPNPC